MASLATDIVINSAFGASSIARGPKTADAILGDIVNTGGQVGVNIASNGITKVITTAILEGTPLTSAGPIGVFIWVVLFSIQLTGILIDSLINPFKTYFNQDLRDLKTSIDANIRRSFVEKGYDYPLEIKPNIDFDTKLIRQYIKQYFDDNGLIFNSDVITEEDIVTFRNSLTRQRKLHINPLYNNINTLSSGSQNSALLIAAAIAKKKGYQSLQDTPLMDIKNYKKNPFLPVINWSLANWQLIIMILLCLTISISLSLLVFN